MVNNHPSNLDYLVVENDCIEVKALDKESHEDKTLEAILLEEVENNKSLNQVAAEIDNKMEQKIKGINVIVNGESVFIEGNQPNFIFIDVFNYIEFDIRNKQGSIVLKLNGNKASYTDVINENDIIDIYWE
jgi:hypothetical protein